MPSVKLQDEKNFKFILRVFNTNLDGKQKVPFALRKIKGVGRRFAFLAANKAGVDVDQRSGELSNEEVEKIVDVITNPSNYNVPNWFLNRQKDPFDGTFSQQVSVGWDTKMREDLEKMKKVKMYRGLRHYFGYKVRGQHTKSTGRRGNIVGVSRKK